jgi:putative tryptophan/tyrosine transport system substrate-binding protein
VKRREFLRLAGGAVAMGPLSARAQQSAMPVIGFLSSRFPDESAGVASAFRQGLAEAGYVVGQNIAIEYRWAEGHYDRLPALAAELVSQRVSAILAGGGPPAAFAAKAATTTIPVIFSAAPDPVRLGLVASLNRPGGNITGMGVFTATLGAKSIELLKQLVPTASQMAYLVNPSNPSAEIEANEVLDATKAIGIALQVFKASTDDELDAAFQAIGTLRADGLAVAGESFFDSRRQKIVALAARFKILTAYAWRENVALGGLLSYGTSLTDSYRRADIYTGRVLKGEKPADLPVMQPTKFEFVVNLKTAKTLGIEVPPMLVARADEVIE